MGNRSRGGCSILGPEAMCQGAPWKSQEGESRSLAGKNQSRAFARSDSVLLEGTRVTALTAGQKLVVSVF